MRIGTRQSALALWQATQVQSALSALNTTSQLVTVSSEGDADLTTPLYEMGVQGIFTRTLDAALLSNKVDIAVHSLKDVPTQLPEGIVQAAVLARGSFEDVLVLNKDLAQLDETVLMTIGTSSIRRQAQFQRRFPKAVFENLRGNMQTRLDKLYSSAWQGAIFAKAGLERINLLPQNAMVLDWMLPAPAQGAVVVVCRENDTSIREMLQQLNDGPTEVTTHAERQFLRSLMGGCSTPISAYARMENDIMHFKGSVCLPDGSDMAEIEMQFTGYEKEAGKLAAEKLLGSSSGAIKAYLQSR